MDTTFTEKQILHDFDRAMDAAYFNLMAALSKATSESDLRRAKDALAAERLRADDNRDIVPGGDNGSEA